MLIDVIRSASGRLERTKARKPIYQKKVLLRRRGKAFRFLISLCHLSTHIYHQQFRYVIFFLDQFTPFQSGRSILAFQGGKTSLQQCYINSKSFPQLELFPDFNPITHCGSVVPDYGVSWPGWINHVSLCFRISPFISMTKLKYGSIPRIPNLKPACVHLFILIV